MIRLSVSDLVTFQYWRDNEDSTMDDLVARLSHTSPATPQMEAGRAFAKFMEHAQPKEIGGVSVDGWHFVFDELDATLELPRVRELKAEMLVDTPHGPVTLVGKCDSLDGVTVQDQKLSERWDPEKYIDSLQWRAYLVMFGCKKFVYDVFLAKYDRAGSNRVYVVDYQQLAFYAYPDMRADVERAVRELADVIVRYGINETIDAQEVARASAAIAPTEQPALPAQGA